METIKPITHVQRILTKRQLEVFELLGKGKDYFEIGVVLNISHKTVANHQTAIFERMKFKHMFHLIYYYLKFVEKVK